VPNNEGVYRLLQGGVASDDVEFRAVHAQAVEQKKNPKRPVPPPLMSVNLAVVDSGTFAEGEQFFLDRLVASGDASGGFSSVRLTKGKPVTTGYHGSHVASIAIAGTAMIKLVDVQICSHQEIGQNNPAAWATGFKWAIGQGARVINCSVICPWTDPAVEGVVQGNTGVLFVATAGNSDREFTTELRATMGMANANMLLVSGCANDGSREAQRGFGSGIDVYAPSKQIPGLVARGLVQSLQYYDARVNADKVLASIEEDRARWTLRRDDLKKQLEEDPGNALAKMQLTMMEKKGFVPTRNVPAVPGSPDVIPVNPGDQARRDNGSSFALPMASNVAAKMMLISPNITPSEIIAIMRDTAEGCAVGRVLDPKRCYEGALANRGGG